MEPIEIISRIVHILGAITLFGGAIFTRWALMPAAEKLPEAEHETLKEHLFKKWRMIVGIAIAMLIFSGFYNYLAVTINEHRGDKLYNALMGIKILLAFVVFFFASALPGRTKSLEWVRKNAKTWTIVTILLATVIVSIASFLKTRGPYTGGTPEIPVEATE